MQIVCYGVVLDVDWNDPNLRWAYALSLVASIVRRLMARGASREDAEDAAQTMVERSPKCGATDEASFCAWANRTAGNALVDLYRARSRAAAAATRAATERLTDTDPEYVVTEKVYRAGKARATMRAILHLPSRQREALLLSVEGATLQQIAEKQNTTRKAAEHIVARAKAAVQERVKATYGGLATVLRPRLVALAAAGVGVLSGLALLVLVRPVAPLRVLPAAPTLASPRAAATSGPARAAEHSGPRLSAPFVVASQPPLRRSLTSRLSLVRPHGDYSLNHPRRNDAGGMSFVDDVVYCVEHVEVPSVPPTYLGCAPRG